MLDYFAEKVEVGLILVEALAEASHKQTNPYSLYQDGRSFHIDSSVACNAQEGCKAYHIGFALVRLMDQINTPMHPMWH